MRSGCDTTTPCALEFKVSDKSTQKLAESRAHETLLNFNVLFSDTLFSRAHGVVVSHPLRMRKALGSNPSVSILATVQKLVGLVLVIDVNFCARARFGALATMGCELPCARAGNPWPTSHVGAVCCARSEGVSRRARTRA